MLAPLGSFDDKNSGESGFDIDNSRPFTIQKARYINLVSDVVDEWVKFRLWIGIARQDSK